MTQRITEADMRGALERLNGQTKPSKCDTANSLEVAQDKLLEHKTGFGFIIEMKAVYQVYRE